MKSWRVEIISKRTKKVVHRLKWHPRRDLAEQVKRGLDTNLDHEHYRTRIVRA